MSRSVRGLRPSYLDDAAEGGERSIVSAFSRFGDVRRPAEAEPPVLGPAVRQALHQWLYELNYAEDLAAVGVKPRRRAMLSGPPGTGKTTLAHHVAARLGVDLVVIETPALISMYVGASGANIGALFALARRHADRIALFFDEFDAVAHRRHEGGSAAETEKNSIVASLLQMFDRYDGLLFAATNRPDVIDPAIWRRFQMQLDVGLPGEAERFAIVKRYAAPFRMEDATGEALSRGLAGASPALIKEVVEALKRDLVLAPRLKHATDPRAVFARTLSAIAPSEDTPCPPLWDAEQGDDAMAEICGAPWPPQRESH